MEELKYTASAAPKWSGKISQINGILQMAVKDYLHYRFAFLSSTVGTALSIVVQMIFWMGVFHLNELQTIVGYDRQAMLSYILVAQIITRLVHASDTLWNYSMDIRTGELNIYLLRPISYTWYRLIMLVAGRMADVVSSALPVGVAILLFIGNIQISSSGLLYGVLMLLAVFYLYYSLDSLIGTLAFWLENVSSIAYFKWVVFGFCGGRFFPIDLLPDWAQAGLDFLPFPYMVYYPVQLIIGQVQELGWIVGRIIIVIAWGIGLTLLRNWLWQQGLKRYMAIGG